MRHVKFWIWFSSQRSSGMPVLLRPPALHDDRSLGALERERFAVIMNATLRHPDLLVTDLCEHSLVGLACNFAVAERARLASAVVVEPRHAFPPGSSTKNRATLRTPRSAYNSFAAYAGQPHRSCPRNLVELHDRLGRSDDGARHSV